jgi:hypothetical protein
MLKTAGGYLLVLHNLDELSSSSRQIVRLLAKAKEEEDWELCKELARFLTALDESGAMLREVLEMVELKSPQDRENSSFMFAGSEREVHVMGEENLLSGLSLGDDGSHSLLDRGSPNPHYIQELKGIEKGSSAESLSSIE